MDVFRFLKEENNQISELLNGAASNYSEWTRDRVFEVVKKALAEVTEHFDNDLVVTSNLKDTQDIEPMLADIQSQREAIKTEVDNLIMVHVDEVGFEEGLEEIASKFDQYSRFSNQVVYPAIESHYSDADLKRVSDQMLMRAS